MFISPDVHFTTTSLQMILKTQKSTFNQSANKELAITKVVLLISYL
jgi:hypothetical protein